MELSNVHLSDIDALRSNAAWKWLNEEWGEILEELQLTLISEDYPAVYRTQGRVSAISELLTTIDKLVELVKEFTHG